MHAPAPAFALPAASPLLLPRRERGLRVVPACPGPRWIDEFYSEERLTAPPGLPQHLLRSQHKARVIGERCTRPRRLTVAVSRPRRKLIVLASQTLFTLMPADLDDYERGALWKQLRHACTSPPLWTGDYGGYQLRMFTVQEP